MIRMMTVLQIIRSVTMDYVISVVNAITATMELTEPAVRAARDTPLKRAVIVQVQLKQLQILCFENAVTFCCCIWHFRRHQRHRYRSALSCYYFHFEHARICCLVVGNVVVSPL